MSTGKIFICHRRGDAVRQVGRLLQTLRNAYGDHTLHYGSHKPSEGKGLCKESLHAMIEARAVLIMIGPNWAEKDNLERLHGVKGEVDSLRRWVALALTRHGAGGPEAPILIPILFDGATMPGKASLPKELKELARLDPLTFSQDETAWPEQYEKLLALLGGALGQTNTSRAAWLQNLWQPFAQALLQLQGPRTERLARYLVAGRMARRR
jgi:hypothetical protein